MRILLTIIFALIWLTRTFAVAESTPLSEAIVQKAKLDCSGFENGEFNSTDQAISLNDLTGDGQPEELIDASQFSCSSALTLWGGTGGTYLWAIVDNEVYEFLAHRWQVVDFYGQKVLLLAVHSSECSDTVGPCYRAYVWQDGFRSTR